MKKKILMLSIICTLIIAWCEKVNTGPITENFYSEKLTVAGVWPEISLEATIDWWTLALHKTFEDHSDHIFIPEWMREPFFTSENEYLPWNIVRFAWTIEQIDAWAWNHYYLVNKVDELKLYSYPTKEEVDDIMDRYNYCEQDDDCVSFDSWCPFSCFMTTNKTYSDIAIKIINNYFMQNDSKCIYDCLKLEWVACEDNKCVALTKKPTIPCTEEELLATECSTELDPVCGDDELSYINKCVACSSNSAKSYYLEWCENDAITTSERPKNWEYIAWILDSDGSVSCEFKYKYKGDNLSWYLAANEENFFSNIDIYYNSKIQHWYHLLTLSDEQRRYDWFDDGTIPWHVYEVFIWSENEIYWILSYLEVFSDLQVECSGWISDEAVFNVPSNANIIY